MEQEIFNIDFLLADHLVIWALLIASLLCLFLIWKEVKRANKKRLALRIGLSVLAVVALLLAVLRPVQYQKEKALDTILLTKDFDAFILDSLQKAMPDAKLFALAKIEFIGATKINNLPSLYETWPQIKSLSILGNGLPNNELTYLKNRQVKFYLTTELEGITDLYYPKTIVEGTSISIGGTFAKRDSNQTILELQSPSGTIELLNKSGAGKFDFSKELIAKKAGRYLFQILEKDVNGLLKNSEQFPVIILPKKPYSVLILNASPNFESKYLKNWLSKQNYEVAVRTSISRDKYKTEFLNRTAINLDQINSAILNRFDVLIISEEQLAQFDNNEITSLQKAIKKGLGLCLLLHDLTAINHLSPKQKRIINAFNFSDAAEIASIKFSPTEAVELKSIPNGINTKRGVFSVIKDEEGTVRSAFVRQGLGRVLVQLLQKTYLLQLQGKPKIYDELWRKNLELIIRKDFIHNEWTIENELLANPNDELHLTLLSDEEKPIGQIKDKEQAKQFYFQQDISDNEKWHSSFWPEKNAWLVIATQAHPKESEWIYMQSDSSWLTMKTRQQIERTQQWIAEHQNDAIISPTLRKNNLYAYPLWWFYVLFLVCVGLLWGEGKV